MSGRLTDEQVAEALRDVKQCLNPDYVSQAFIQVSADLSAAKEARDADVQDATRGYAECESRLIDATQRLRTAEAALSALQEAARRAVGEYVCPNCHSARTALSSLRAHLPEDGR